ncbi:probable disease resistance protein At5g66900 isoform X2 [Prosopis cineraria]|uniref:probable disease resistance protein At5g66900 isoform X2 n=1 Tax=Prosopis cineraria TaxID=364024 RepID=UPI00240EC139|nr:probable disease resistance protein At5g66900 isoform X2 [Prosopis cineraria]
MAEVLIERVLDELLSKVFEAKARAIQFRPTLERLAATLESIKPVIEQINLYNRQLDRSGQEIDKLIKDMKNGEKLVLKCSKIQWWECCYKPQYQEQLEDLDQSLVRFFQVDMQVQTARDAMETLIEVRGIRVEMKKLNAVARNERGQCSAPEPPAFTVGLDVHVGELKLRLLRDDVSVMVITGLAGSGKTALAKKFCWDVDVRGKFKDNIFFVKFSETPNLNLIVRKLYQHNGRPVPEPQNDEDAIDQLKLLLKQIGENPTLLVLDDVGDRSESLVDNFVMQLRDYKILVTSRFAIRRFGTLHSLKPLGNEDAMKLFRHSAELKESSLDIPDHIVREIVRGCSGSPMVLNAIGRSLCGQHSAVWQSRAKELSKGRPIFESNEDLLDSLLKSFDVSVPKSVIKERFMDLGLFPEDQKIPAASLVDMWVELHGEDDVNAMEKIYELATRNVLDIVIRSLLLSRKFASGTGNLNSYFVMRHDLFQELAIHQRKISQEPLEKRKRLIINITGNDLPQWWTEQKEHHIAAHVLSISTDELFSSNWCNLIPTEVEVLVLNLRGKKYTIPKFIEKMGKLKVMLITNYGFHPAAELEGLELLNLLYDLKRIRLERVSIPSLIEKRVQLKNLQKLSLFMCNVNEAFKNCSIQVSDMMPNLVELNIDYCNMVELPVGLCGIVFLKKLSITSCHKLSALPDEIGKLANLELLRLSSCSDLAEFPDSVTNLQKLKLLDISYCVSLIKLPDHMGELLNLEELHITCCSRLCDKLPPTIINLTGLRVVVCDEEMATLWEPCKTVLTDLHVEVTQADIGLEWL